MQNHHSRAERIQGLKTGRGLQYLLREAYEIFGNPILIHDMEYKVIDLNQDIVTDDPIWIEYAATGTVGYHWLDFFKNECFLEAAANTKKITFLTSDKLAYDRIFCKVFNKHNIQVGCAVMVECNKSFEYNDSELFEAFCAVLSAELSTIEFFTEYGQVYFEKLLAELIAGIDDIPLYTAHVESIYMHLKSNLYLAVADVGKCDPSDAELAHFRDLFRETQPEYTYALYAKYIIIIIDTDGGTLYEEKHLNALNQLFHQYNITAGISSAFENLFELNQYYQEALDALSHSLGLPSQRIFMHEQQDS